MNNRPLPHFAMLGAALLVAGSATSAHAAAEADLLVSYDQTYPPSVGGQDNANTITANAVAGSNDIQARSGTGQKVRIVGYYQAAQYSYQRTSKGGFVGWLNSYDSRLSDVVDAGNARGADLVTFICVSTSDGAAAVASQPGRYSAFDPGSFWSAVVAHELGGHNYGCDHRGGRGTPGQKTIMMHNYCEGGGSTPPYIFSNPNIRLNGARLVGEGSCLGDAVNGGDNAYLISTTCQGVADRNNRVITSPNLVNVVRRWSFNQSAASAPSGTTVVDAVSGTAVATVLGSGATFTGQGLRLPGGASGSSAAYVKLPASILSGYTNATIEIWAKALSVQNWARLLDFNNGTANYITLTSSTGTNLNSQRFESMNGGTAVTLDSGLPTAVGALHHYAITYASTGASTGRWTWYRDGDEIAYLDVAYALSALQDVNNWLGRSAYAADAFANCEYSEIRISNAALTRDQIAANARLGPNWKNANANLTADDPIGQTSFNAAGSWSDGTAPAAGKNYETYGFRLRTPADATSRTFAGQSLKLTGGSLVWKGTSSSTITINDLTLTGSDGEVLNAGSGTWTLAGNLKADADETLVRAANGAINISANLSGSGALLFVNNTVTLSGNNTAFTGRTAVGDGRFSGLSIDSETRLGANPATFTADQLTLNRGILYTTVTLTIDDANRGIRLGQSAAIFNVAPATTLTLSVPLSSVTSGSTLVTTPQYPNPSYGFFIKENSGTLVLTHPNNSNAGEIVINSGTFQINGAGRLNNGDQALPITNNGTLTFNTTASQTVSGAISGTGPLNKSNTGTLTLSGANPMTGAVTINAGTLYATTANAANNRAFSFVSSVTVNGGGTLRSSGNALFGWDGAQEKPITVNAGATLTADAGADVGLGTVTLAGGTLASLGTSTAYGTWRFDETTDKLLVTADSTVSATNVKFGNAGAAIEVAAGRTLNFTGTITDATSGGISYLTKTGTGVLTLAGVNTFTGATAVNAGTLTLTGSLAGNTPVTIASGATLSGTGSIGGNVTFSANAIHAPGNPTGTQAISGTLSYESGARVKFALSSDSTATGAASRASATGAVSIAAGAAIDLTFNVAGSTVNFVSAFWTQPRSWPVVTGGSLGGTFTLGTISSDASGNAASTYGGFSLVHTTTGAVLQWTPKAFTAWRGTKFGGAAGTLATSGFLADPDGDALANGFEYFYDTDPGAVTVTPLAASTSDGAMKITLPRNTAATDVQAKVQGSDAPGGPWTDLAQSTAGGPFTAIGSAVTVKETGSGTMRAVEITDEFPSGDPAHPRRYFRLWIQQQ